MRTTFKQMITFVLMAVLLASCGDVFMKKSKDDNTSLEQFATCTRDFKTLANIFTENIKGDLLCLEQNLNLFIDVVKTDRPGNLSLKELKLYIQKNVKDISPEIIEALSGIFEINALIYGDDIEYINKGNVRKLIQLFIDINKAMVDNKVFEYYDAPDLKISFAEHNRRKMKIFSAFSIISTRLNEEFTGQHKAVNFIKLLEKFQQITDNIVLNNCHKLLYIKRMFLGGEEEVLTTAELKRLATMLPDIGKVAFDMMNLSNVEHSDSQDEEIILTLKENAETIVKNLYYKGQDYTNVLTIDNIFDTVQIFIPGSKYGTYNTKYRKYILQAKKAFFENSSEWFNSNELMILFDDIILSNLKKSAFFYRMYSLNTDVLEQGNIIRTDLPGIINSGKLEEFYRDEFNRIVKSYRFFKGKQYSSSYNNKIKRNAFGIIEVALLEDAVRRLFAAYGRPDTASLGGYKISQDQLTEMMLSYEEFLVGEGMADEGRIKNTAETITLMTSLFQSQSDGDSNIEVNEMVEFAIELLSSSSVASMGDKFFQKQCQVDEKNRYSPECYRANFLGMMDLEKDGVYVKEYYGKLNDFLSNPSTDVVKYLEIAEVFTRSCTYFDDGTPVPMNESELFLLLSGLIAVEQTMVRYDKNNDNILQPSEVDAAYSVYEGAIKALIPGAFLQKFSKIFYQYLIKYKKVPDVQNINSMSDLWRALKEGSHFVGFLFKSKKNRESDADRYTLATILKTLSEMSPANIENPFPCETLR